MGLKRCLVYSNANSYLTIYIFKDQIYLCLFPYIQYALPYLRDTYIQYI